MLLDSIKNTFNKIKASLGANDITSSINSRIDYFLDLQAIKINHRLEKQGLSEYKVSRLDLCSQDLRSLYDSIYDTDDLREYEWCIKWMYDVQILLKMAKQYELSSSVLCSDLNQRGTLSSANCCVLESHLCNSHRFLSTDESHDWTDINFSEVFDFLIKKYHRIHYVNTHFSSKFSIEWEKRKKDYEMSERCMNIELSGRSSWIFVNFRWDMRKFEFYDKFYEQHVEQQCTPLDDKFDDHCDQFDLVSKLSTAEYEVLSEFTKDDKKDLLQLGNGVFVAGVKAVCHKYLQA